MKVFSLLYSEPYEGSNFLGVFGSLEDAINAAKKDSYSGDLSFYEVVESELGVCVGFGNGNAIAVHEVK